MPTYDFKCLSCEHVFEVVCAISEMKNQECPKCQAKNYERFHGQTPSIGDSVRLGIRTIDDGFREVLSKIHNKTYKSNLGEKLSRSK